MYISLFFLSLLSSQTYLQSFAAQHKQRQQLQLQREQFSLNWIHFICLSLLYCTKFAGSQSNSALNSSGNGDGEAAAGAAAGGDEGGAGGSAGSAGSGNGGGGGSGDNGAAAEAEQAAASG